MFRSLTTIKADLARTEFGITGKGVVWAVIATGVDGRHPHFTAHRNLNLPHPLRHLDYSNLYESLGDDWHSRDFILEGHLFKDDYLVRDPVDVQGLGTAVAGVIAGEGLDPYSEQTIRGVAPEARILSVKVFDDSGQAREFNTIAALKAIQQLNQLSRSPVIHGVVIPLSIGWDVRNYACGHSPICAEVDRLVNSGVAVVTCSGNTSYDNEGARVIEGGITDPGNAEMAITVGATHRSAPQIYGASYFSSRGPTADGRKKPDILAPGERITVCARSMPPEKSQPAPKKQKGNRGSKADRPPQDDRDTDDTPGYTSLDGTQIAAAHVAGAAAALQALQPSLIGRPQDLKDLLLRTAVDLHRESMYQGHGLLDLLAAARASAGPPAADGPRADPLKVFVSYSHRDQALWKEFKAHLSPMERSHRIEIWSDQQIEAGQRWEQEIYDRLGKANIILLLVSAHFFESEFCYSKELKVALDRDGRGDARIVPVLVRPVSMKGTILAAIQALPPGARPITSFGDPHKGWTLVADHLFDIVEKMTAQRQAGRPYTA